MDRRLRNRILIFLVLAGVVVFALVRLTGRQPVAKINAVMPARENVISSISSNGKVEPIAPFVVRAQLDTFVEKISAVEGQQVKKGHPLLELNVKDAEAQLADARSKLLRAEYDLRAAKAGGRSDEAAKTDGALANGVAQRDRMRWNG
jgi:HlyD family secretion protein